MLLVAAACSGGGSAAPALPLRRVDDVALPGSNGRFDYVSLDAGRHLLVIAHLADSTVIGFDIAVRRVVWQAHGVRSVHGVRVAPEIGRAYASATGTNEVVALDDGGGAALGRAPTGRFPDGLAYDPRRQAVFVSDKDGGTVTVVDAKTFAVLGTVPVGADVGNVQYDDVADTMVVAVGSTNELVTVDAASRRVGSHVALPGCRGAHGVAVDAQARRAFVACEHNATVVSVDLARGAVTGTQPTGSTPDVLAVDASLNRLYVAAESGVVSAYTTSGASLRLIGKSKVADNAHTVAVDPVTHLVYLPLANLDGHPALRVLRPGR